ncbi:uncharacterized protein LOC126381633 [Pectinophora gossypiella]|uniref:uncharacterized protein LOC126381633 n=1 Tax=Pectinophora gossypiella TaxID=13191 RepID=UPI00214E8AAE|nr:uncharacterized protein LOC126381633 [Pectinophora gossypiella]
MSVESGERRLASLLDEVLDHSSDEASLSEVSDHCSEHEQESDTQDIHLEYEESSEWDSDDNIPLLALRTSRRSTVSTHAPHYKSKDGQKWFKQAPRTNVRIRSENILDEHPGAKGIAKDAKTEGECWNIFFTEEMKGIILVHTNEEILRRQLLCKDPSRLYFMKETTSSELDAFISDAKKSMFHMSI